MNKLDRNTTVHCPATCMCGGLHVSRDDLPDEVLQDLVEGVPLSSLAGSGPELDKVRLFSSLALLGSSLFFSQGPHTCLSLVQSSQLSFLHRKKICYDFSEGEF